MNIKEYVEIDPILLRDKHDLINADRILGKIGFNFLSEEKKKAAETWDDINNNYLIADNVDSGWRIQSHYIGSGIPIDKLEQQVDNILKNFPSFPEQIKEIEQKRKELTDKVKTIYEELSNIILETKLKIKE